MFISKLSKALNKYDQYGLLRINTWQSVMVAVCLFFINFIYNPPYMQQCMVVFLFSLIMVGGVASYYKRQSGIILFTVLSAMYSILINLVREYNLFTILMVGFVLGCLYLFAKKYAILAAMAPILHMVATTCLKIDADGNGFVYLYFLTIIGFLLILVLATMNLFPKIYYFRVWLRSYYLTLDELAGHFEALAKKERILAQKRFQHLLAMNSFTISLDYQQHGFSARRINILVARVYKFFIAARNDIVPHDSQQLAQLADICTELKNAIGSSRQINYTLKENRLPPGISHSLQQLSIIWNKLCLQKI